MTSSILFSLLLLLSGALAGSQCPEKCNCNEDSKGRREVVCSSGSLIGAIPVIEMEPDIEVLKVSAPENMENWLTIGPIFQGFQLLEEIHITRSNVPAIGKNSFWGLPSLKVLDLQHNNISQVIEGNFQGLINLQELRLDWNRIESMGSGTFQLLQSLRALSLKGNKIFELVPRLFLNLTKLGSLDLSYNNLTQLHPNVFKDIQELKTFSCRQCNLNIINHHVFELLFNLEHLDLGENRFKKLGREEFKDLKNLLSLKLDGNELWTVPDGIFTSQNKLQHLNLAKNQINKISNHAFDHLNDLLELDLSYNKLIHLEPITFQPLAPNLRFLSISGNNVRVEEFFFVLKITTRLQDLGLADLNVEQGFPNEMLTFVKSLKHLNISGNGMTDFDPEFLSPVTSLSLLDLSRNRLFTLNRESVSRLEYISNVLLSDNIWACDLCHIHAILLSNASWVSSLICKTPQYLGRRSVDSLVLDELQSCIGGQIFRVDKSFASLTHKSQIGLMASWSAVVLFFVTVFILVVVVYYNKTHTAFYYTHEEQRKRNLEIISRDKKVSIATIDEISKDPELQSLSSFAS